MNFSENIINTVMDVTGKSKDNVMARLDMKELCVRDELHIHIRENGTNRSEVHIVHGTETVFK